MSHAHRVDFAQQCKQHIVDGLSVADFVNQHADRIAKDSDYLVMIAAESCLLAKQPEQIKELFQQLLRVENSQYKTKLIGKGFEFLATRNQKHPEILNEWYLHLASNNSRDYTMQLGKAWKNLSKAPKHHAFLHYMSITPLGSRRYMEGIVLECVKKQVWDNPQLFMDVVREIAHLPSATKLESYKSISLPRLEKSGVLEALLSSLDPVDQNTFFVHFCSNKYYARNNKSFAQDVDAFSKYWESIMPHLCNYITEVNSGVLDDVDNGRLRQQLRPGLLLIVTLTHHYLRQAVVPDVNTTVKMYEQISLYFKQHGPRWNMDQREKVLMEEIEAKLQSFKILQEVDGCSVSTAKRKL